MSRQYELANPPEDVISSIAVSPDSSTILVGSWDAHLHIYARDEQGTFSPVNRCFTQGPVLDICWGSGGKSFYWVGLDGDVRQLEFSPGTTSTDQIVLSSHDKASNKIAYSVTHDILLSTSWDCTMHVHHPGNGSFVSIVLPGKPFALSLSADRAVVAMAERKVAVYDLAVLRTLLDEHDGNAPDQSALPLQPWQERESSLKFMTRAIECMPDGLGFATSSIEGRVGVEWFDPEYNDKNKYAFKCHRQTSTTVEDGVEEEVDVVYPVNALAFHPVQAVFATGGGDGAVALWDAKSKRRVRQFPKLGAGVGAVDFSPDGKFLAIGISPGFEDDLEDEAIDKTQVKVIVKELAEGDIKAKAAK